MANLGLLAGLVTGAYQALQNKFEQSSKPAASGGGSVSSPAPAAGGSGASAYSPPSVTEYYDPTGQKREGYIINGQTYQDQAGKNAVGLGSLVQAGGGWYQKTANGGVKVNAPTGVNYTDADGSRAYGYLVNGQTYRDPLGKNPIAMGSIVQTGGGNFLKTEKGGIPATDWDALRLQMAAQENKLNAAADTAYQASKLQYEQQKPGVNGQYDTAARQLYSNYMQEKQAMPEQLARLGLAGQGVSETTAARMSNTYQGNLSQSEIARRQALSEIDNQIAQLYANAQSQKTQNAATVQGNIANAYQSYLQQQQAQKNTDREYAMTQQQWDYEKQQNAYAQALSKAELLAQYGDFSGYAAMGIDTTKMKQQWAAQQAAAQAAGGRSRSSGGSSSRKSGSGSSTTKNSATKLGYSQLRAEIINAADPAARLEELGARQSISASDYEKLKKEITPDFDAEMQAVQDGRITYAQIKKSAGTGSSVADAWIDAYGYQKYLELLKEAYKVSGGR